MDHRQQASGAISKVMHHRHIDLVVVSYDAENFQSTLLNLSNDVHCQLVKDFSAQTLRKEKAVWYFIWH